MEQELEEPGEATPLRPETSRRHNSQSDQDQGVPSDTTSPDVGSEESDSSDPLLDTVAQLARVSREDIEKALREGAVDRETLAAEVDAFAGDVKARWSTITETYPELIRGKGSDSKSPIKLWNGERHSFLEMYGTVFRFPNEERTHEEVARELALLSELSGRLSVLVPKVKYHNPEEPEWFKQFIGYPEIPGRRLENAFLNRHAGAIQLAHALGGILSEVHATKLGDAVSRGMNQEAPDDVYEMVDKLYREMPRVTGSFKGEDFERTFESFFTLALEEDEIYDFRPTLTHGRFSEHVLFSGPSRPEGLTGWGNAQIGDPACDFADVMHFVGPLVIGDVFGSYQTRDSIEGLWKRTLVRWGIGLLFSAAYAEERGGAPDYVYMDLVREHVSRLWGQTPRAGKRSIISKAARLRRS